jgi:hypothetical protein
MQIPPAPATAAAIINTLIASFQLNRLPHRLIVAHFVFDEII